MGIVKKLVTKDKYIALNIVLDGYNTKLEY